MVVKFSVYLNRHVFVMPFCIVIALLGKRELVALFSCSLFFHKGIPFRIYTQHLVLVPNGGRKTFPGIHHSVVYIFWSIVGSLKMYISVTDEA